MPRVSSWLVPWVPRVHQGLWCEVGYFPGGVFDAENELPRGCRTDVYDRSI